ncbi:hypothetical protein RB600_005506 [Gaeumannomyces tritici]
MTMQLSSALAPPSSAPAAAPQPVQVQAQAHTHAHAHAYAHAPSYARSVLPPRNVREDTIEDAYVQFILCCNPAVPHDTDTTGLKDAFRVPPKSEGKTFSTFHLYQLIGQLTQKEEIKTWGDLALRLGVEPPNHEKNQSTQKIQQYAVRLKRWMKSMHIDAFFDYLYNNPHPYWTQIPHEHIPIEEIVRDGVAPEDDMALRALLPHIRPRRGRRTREDDEAARPSSSKVARIDSPPAPECAAGGRTDLLEPWAAGSEGRNSAHQGLGAPSTSHPWAPDASQTPFTAHPQSAITPSTRADFWADEPRSAMTPNKSSRGHKRHGPKVVSSAWRSGQASSGKTRGRPPINRASNEGPFSAYPADGSTMSAFRPSPPDTAVMPVTPTTAPSWAASSSSGGNSTMAVADVMTTLQQQPQQQLRQHPQLQHEIQAQPQAQAQPQLQQQHQYNPHSQQQRQQRYPTPPALPSLNAALSLQEQQPQSFQGERPSKPKGLSLQVPERVGGEIRLATPPPVVMVNGLAMPMASAPASTPPLSADRPLDGGVPSGDVPQTVVQDRAPEPFDYGNPRSNPNGQLTDLPPPIQMPEEPGPKQKVNYLDSSDRTNVEALQGFFMHEIMTGNWVDKNGNKLPAGGADEAAAIVATVIETLQKEAPNEKTFLLNASALAGGKLLMTTTSLKITVIEVLEDRTEYSCEWQLQLGSCKGLYKMTEVVYHAKWKLPPPGSLGLINRHDANVAAAAKPSPPAPAKAPSEGASSIATASTDTVVNKSSIARPAGVGVGDESLSGQPGVPIGSGTAAQTDGGTVEHWKEKCRKLTELLDSRKTEHPADHWRNMYLELAEMYKSKDLELARFQSRIMEAMRDPRLDRE